MADPEKRVLALATLTAGPEAIGPVINKLRRQGIKCDVLLGTPAESNRGKIEGDAEVVKSFSPACLRSRLAAGRPTSILTDAAAQEKGCPVTAEQMLWEAGKEAGIPSVAVMDTWGNEKQRFIDLDLSAEVPLRSDAPITRLPSTIAVIDEYQRKEMLRLGFPEGMLAVTGNPYFEKVAEDFGRLSPGTREALLAKPVFSGFHPDGKLIVFMSDSMSVYPDIGFTEKSVLRSFLKAMDALAKSSGMKINVIVRPHPFRGQDASEAFNYETPNMRKVLHNPVSARGSDPQNDYSMEQLLYAAGLVVGTFNNPLVTAKICGKPVIHWLPGIAPGYDFQKFMSDQGLSTRITDGGDLGELLLRRAVVSILYGPIQQKSMGSVHGATDRVIALL